MALPCTFTTGTCRRALPALGTWLLLTAAACQLATAEAVPAPLTYNFVKFPPFQYVSEATKEAEGVTLDLLRVAAAQVNEPLRLQQLPQQRMVQLTRAGRLQLAFVSSFYIAQAKDHYHCSAEPLTRLRPAVYVNRAQHPTLERLEQLANEVVYAPQSTSHTLAQLLPPGTKTDDSNADKAIVRMFAKQRLGLVVDFQEHMEPPLVALSPQFAYRKLALPNLDIVLCINPNIANYQARHYALEQAVLAVAHSQAGADIFAAHGMFLTMRKPSAAKPSP
ncbi:transporter substrate-binding domain-containing protein [Simiduia sp. 21SJ11W-1]|uniref:transporter substrate-binding domain-containing protein n=1 Tax=Simiduia sp. 21SJ11W-1 TaxID=2909669 RepID=UPI00209CBD23|nr:transporter substrate-binding domain-containing protein [Simiduia sp. 21SJ11W-1]UTA48481.1 transporter substrate-binding domain-containing protein [Simiduia sp. 21SJ11W-1]